MCGKYLKELIETIILSAGKTYFDTKILVLIAFATREDSDEPAHMCSVPRAFTACTHKVRNVDEGWDQNLGILPD